MTQVAIEYTDLLKEPVLLNRRQTDLLSDARKAAAEFPNCAERKLRWYAELLRGWVLLLAICRFGEI